VVALQVDDTLLMRTYTPEDATELFGVIDGSRSHLHPFLPWVDKTTKPEHSLQFIQDSLTGLHEQRSLALGIFLDGHIIGGVGMHQWDRDTKKAEMGYWLATGYEGRGIMASCIRVFIAYLFDKLGLNKVEIRFLPANKRSARVAQRAGFTTEGIIRKSILHNGVAEDLVVTGLLKSERAMGN
jgi:ribosomal-protein-serine acetyltransferase